MAQLKVSPTGKDRYLIWLIDERGVTQGPDGGPDNEGYTADELRFRLRDKVSNAELETGIASVDLLRPQRSVLNIGTIRIR
jgi:hypothetical protein